MSNVYGPTILGYTFDDKGMPTGRVSWEDDTDTNSGPKRDHCPATQGVHYFATDGNDYFASDHEWSDVRDAWERFEAEAEHKSERVEMLQRWNRIFHPMRPMLVTDIATGYGQGDHAGVILWGEASEREDDGTPAYLQAAKLHKILVAEAEELGAYARGQFAVVTYETASYYSPKFDDDTVTAEALWSVEDSIGGVFYRDDVHTDEELRGLAPEFFDIELAN